MADESANLTIRTDTDEIVQASAQVERLQRSLDAAKDAVNRGAPGWEMQARNIAGMTAELVKAESQLARFESAQRRAMAALAEGDAVRKPGGGGRRMDAGQTTMMGFNIANAAQDAMYSPAAAVNNLMFMAQMSGGVKELGKDLQEFASVAVAGAGNALKNLPSMFGTVATAAAGAAGTIGTVALPILGVALAGAGVAASKGLKDAGLAWSDLTDVLANTTVFVAAGDILHELGDAWDFIANSDVGDVVGGVWSTVKYLVHETANLTLGWDDATEAVKRNKEATQEAAIAADEWAKKVGEAQSALANIKSEDQKDAAKAGGQFAEDIAGLGGAKGIEGFIDKVSALGITDETGARIGGPDFDKLMSAAAKGDESAIESINAMGLTDADEEAVDWDRLRELKANAVGGDKDAAGELAGYASTANAGRDALRILLADAAKGDADAIGKVSKYATMAGMDPEKAARDRETDMLNAEGAKNEEVALRELAAAQKQQAADSHDAAMRAAEAETELTAERLRQAEAARKAAEASRNAIEASALELEQKKALANYDRRVDKRAEAYGNVYGGAIARAQYAAAARGEDQETTDERLKGQLMARMRNVDPSLRQGTAEAILKRSRGMAEDFAIQRGVQGDVMGSALGEMATRGDQRTFAGQLARQRALAAGRGMGLDVNAYGRDIEKAAPGREQLEAAKTMQSAVKDFRDVIRNVQVTL